MEAEPDVGGPWSGLGDSASEKGVIPHLIIWACEPLWGAGRGCSVSGKEVDPVVSPWSARGRGTLRSVSPPAGLDRWGPGHWGAPGQPVGRRGGSGLMGLRARRGAVSDPRRSWWPGCPRTCSSCPGSQPCSDARPEGVRGQGTGNGPHPGGSSLKLRMASRSPSPSKSLSPPLLPPHLKLSVPLPFCKQEPQSPRPGFWSFLRIPPTRQLAPSAHLVRVTLIQ